jgi:CIC family chloride channel protein
MYEEEESYGQELSHPVGARSRVAWAGSRGIGKLLEKVIRCGFAPLWMSVRVELSQYEESGEERRYAAKGLISSYTRLVVLSASIGLLVGLSVVAFFSLYREIWTLAVTAVGEHRYAVIFMPPLGLALAYLTVRGIAKTKTTGCGTHQILEAYHYEGGVISPRDTAAKTLASALTISFGGSAGLEGPSLLLGGGIASAIGRRLNLRPGELKVYLLSGSAAGLAAIFKAPLTGILFALEIPYQRDIAQEAFIPATVSSLTAYFTLVNILGVETLFPSMPVLAVPSISVILHAFAVGLTATFCGVAFVKVFDAFNNLRLRIRLNALTYPLIGGLSVGLVGLYVPEALGVGYDTIQRMATGKLHASPLVFLVALLFLKMLATSATLSSGGSGGLFIPSIYVGAVLGGAYAKAALQAPSEVIVVAAMAAMIAATSKTLLTSVAFVAETTGPSSVIPALVAAATSYFTSGRHSFYRRTQPLEKPVEEEEELRVLYHLIEKKRSSEKLGRTKVSEIMTSNPVALNDDMRMDEALDVVKRHGYRAYPVVTRGQVLIGYATVEDLLTIPEDRRSLSVSHTVMRRPLSVTKEDTLLTVVNLMLERRIDHAYVVSDPQTMRLVGVLAGTDLVRKLLERL